MTIPIPELENSGLGLQLTWQNTHPACLNTGCNSQHSTNQGYILEISELWKWRKGDQKFKVILVYRFSILGNIVCPKKQHEYSKRTHIPGIISKLINLKLSVDMYPYLIKQIQPELKQKFNHRKLSKEEKQARVGLK